MVKTEAELSFNRANPSYVKIESDVVTVATTITLAAEATTEPNSATKLAHNFVGAQFFTSAAGDTFAVPGAGTVVVTVETINNLNVFEAVPDNTITGTAATTVTWDANTAQVRLVPSGITTATHWKAVWTANRT